MNIVLNKYVGESVMNAVRQAAMCCIEEVRPIAFKVGLDSNVIAISDFVEEDMTEFISNVCSSSFVASPNSDDLVEVTVEANGVLTVKDLCTNSIAVAKFGIVDVLHTMKSTNVTVWFRRASGAFREKENVQFLEDHRVDTSHLVVINSRHCPVTVFHQQEVSRSEDSITFSIEIRTNSTVTENEVLERAISFVKSEVNSIDY